MGENSAHHDEAMIQLHREEERDLDMNVMVLTGKWCDEKVR